MKKIFSYILIAAALFITTEKTTAQNANTSLSNLVKTKINQSLLPKKTNTYNLGANNSAWKNLYLADNLFLDGNKFITNKGTTNTVIGNSAGNLITTGLYNTASGDAALNSNTDGGYNTAFGASALVRNTSASYNTAIGIAAMYYNTTGVDNTSLGAYAMYNNTGSYNTGLGYYALTATTGAQFNTAIGFAAGDSYDNGYNNVFVGANTDVNGTGYYNVVAIGQGTICTASSQVTIGNGSTDSYRAYANWSNISDGRVKKNIRQNVPGLAFINKLQPITYNLDLDAADKIIQYQRKDSAGKIIPLSNIEKVARTAKGKILYTGFVAQDVEKAAKSLNYDFSGVDAAKNSKDLYALRYAEFVVPLVKAVQELSKQNDSLKSEIGNLKSEMENIKAMIVSNNQQATINNQSAKISSSTGEGWEEASLQQNIPNPFSNTTTINYLLPQKFSSAKIIITDNKGAVLKQINLNNKRNGSVHLDASTLAAGAYQYSLYVDEKLIDTKRMVLGK